MDTHMCYLLARSSLLIIVSFMHGFYPDNSTMKLLIYIYTHIRQGLSKPVICSPT
jgi:hypothetical protein